jgi:hypothetical protein
MKKAVVLTAITLALFSFSCSDGTRRDYDDEGHNEGVIREDKHSDSTRYDNPGKVNDTTEAAKDRD